MTTYDDPIIIEQDFPSSLEELWLALTEPEQMRRWYFDNIPDFRPEAGFTTEFMVDAGEREFQHQWQVTEAHQPNRLSYRWQYGGYKGAALAVFELSGDDRSAFLRFEFQIEEDFDDSIPEFRRESCVAGWQYFISESLSKYLTGHL